jgi:hypothetical protein
MKRELLGAIALALVTATPAFAGHGAKHQHNVTSWGSESGEGDDGVFSLATLNGTYIFKASGSLNNGSAATADILGTLTFDGLGGVIGNLTMTAADGGQFSCNNTFTVGGTYALPTPVSGPGLGTMILPMTTGSINFNLLVPSTEGKSADAIQSDTGALVPGTTFCTATPTTMALKGQLTRVDGGGSGGGD